MNAFSTLRQELPEIRFDTNCLVPADSIKGLQSYLDYYQLSFPQTVCKNYGIGTFNSQQYQIVAQYWVPHTDNPAGTVFIIHGYYDHVGLFSHLIEFALQHNYVVVAYDQPGHGLSSGERGNIESFSDYAGVLADCANKAEGLPKPWNVIAQSTGAAVVLHSMLCGGQQYFSKNVLLAPLIKPINWKRNKWVYQSLRFILRSVARKKVPNSNDETFVEFCHIDPLQPQRLMVGWVGAMKEWLELFPDLNTVQAQVLIIQGDDDDTVDWAYNVAAIEEKIQSAETVYIGKAKHHLANESIPLRSQVLSSIEKFLLA